jgi:putative membrane protein
MTASRLLGQEARARISQAVGLAEAKTIGQIVPVVVDRSDHYPEAPLRAALLGAALAAAASFWVSDVGVPTSLIIVGGTALVAAGWTLLIPGLHRLLAGGRALEARVHHRALRAFVQHGVHHTRGETGVLVFASLFERRVVILGDRAIHEKMGEAGWQQAVSALTSGLRQGKAAEGFVAAIGIVGEKLAASFPKDAGTPRSNELSDELRVDNS